MTATPAKHVLFSEVFRNRVSALGSDVEALSILGAPEPQVSIPLEENDFTSYRMALRSQSDAANAIARLVRQNVRVIFSIDLCELVDVSRLDNTNIVRLAEELDEDKHTFLSDAIFARSVLDGGVKGNFGITILPGAARELLNFLRKTLHQQSAITAAAKAFGEEAKQIKDDRLIYQYACRLLGDEIAASDLNDILEDMAGRDPVAVSVVNRARELFLAPEFTRGSELLKNLDTIKADDGFQTELIRWMDQMNAQRPRIRNSLANFFDAMNLASASALNQRNLDYCVIHVTRTASIHRALHKQGHIPDSIDPELHAELDSSAQLIQRVGNRRIPRVVSPRTVWLFSQFRQGKAEPRSVEESARAFSSFWNDVSLEVENILREITFQHDNADSVKVTDDLGSARAFVSVERDGPIEQSLYNISSRISSPAGREPFRVFRDYSRLSAASEDSLWMDAASSNLTGVKINQQSRRVSTAFFELSQLLSQDSVGPYGSSVDDVPEHLQHPILRAEVAGYRLRMPDVLEGEQPQNVRFIIGDIGALTDDWEQLAFGAQMIGSGDERSLRVYCRLEIPFSKAIRHSVSFAQQVAPKSWRLLLSEKAGEFHVYTEEDDINSIVNGDAEHMMYSVDAMQILSPSLRIVVELEHPRRAPLISVTSKTFSVLSLNEYLSQVCVSCPVQYCEEAMLLVFHKSDQWWESRDV